MMKLKMRICLLAITFVWMGINIVSAADKGSLSGIVVSEGTPLEDATVILINMKTSENRMFVTGLDGKFHFSDLESGEYFLEVVRQCYKPVRKRKIDIYAGRSDFHQIEMEPSVASGLCLGDKYGKQHITGISVPRSFLEQLPGWETYKTVYSMTPGVSGGLDHWWHIHGAGPGDTLVQLDGLTVTNPLTLSSDILMNQDVVDRIDVLTGSLPAKYGGTMGGITDIETRDGDDEFHSVFRLMYRDSSWDSDADHPTYQPDYDAWDPFITFSGPIVRDKLTFIASYRQKTDPPYFLDYMRYPVKVSSYETDCFFGSLKFTPTDQHIFRFRISWSDRQEDVSDHAPNRFFDKRKWSMPVIQQTWDWLFRPDLIFHFSIGYVSEDLETDPYIKTDDPREAPFDNMMYGSSLYNNWGTWEDSEQTRWHMAFNGKLNVENLAGYHTFESGISWNQVKDDNMFKIPGGAAYRIDPYSGYEMKAYRDVVVGPEDIDVKGNIFGFYIQDDWQVMENLTFNVGIRYDYSKYEGDNGDSSVPAWRMGWFAADSYRNPDGSYREYTDMIFDDMLAPRVGMNWDILRDGRINLHAFYGRYYNPFDLTLPKFFQAERMIQHQEYTGPEWHDSDGDGVPDEGYFFDDNNWRDTESESGMLTEVFLDPDLKPEYTDEITLGLSYQISKHVIADMTFLYRYADRLIDDVGLFMDDEGNVIWTYLGGVKDDLSELDPSRQYDPKTSGYNRMAYYVTNPDGHRRRYQGLDLMLRGSMKNIKWLLSYTLSKARGSVTEHFAGQDEISHFTEQFDTFQTSENLYGELPWSSRHYLRLAGLAHYNVTDWYEIGLGVNAFVRSGYRYSKRTIPSKTYDSNAPDNDPDDPGTWSGTPPYQSYYWTFPEGRGTYELPSFYNIDISLQNAFHIGKWGTFTLIFDIDNVTDYQGVVHETEEYTPKHPEGFGQADIWGTPRTYRLSLKYTF